MKRYLWILTRDDGDMVDYSARMGPVTAAHVRRSPAVLSWADGHAFTVTYPLEHEVFPASILATPAPGNHRSPFGMGA